MQRRVADRLRLELGEDFDESFASGKTLTHEEAQSVLDPALLTGPATLPPR